MLALLVATSIASPLAARVQQPKPVAPALIDEDKDGLPGASVGPSRAEIEDLIRAIGRDPVSPELVDRIDSLFRPRWAGLRKFEEARLRVMDKTFLANMDMFYNEVNKKPGRADTRALVYRAVSLPNAPTIDDLRDQFRDDLDRENGRWKTLKGRVLGDEIGGKPIAGAVLSSISGTIARTNAKGEFTLKMRAPKTPFPMTINVEAPGRALTQYGFKWDDMPDVETEVFRIPPAVSFAGRVIDPQGKPIAGADLDLWIAQEAVCRDGSLAKLNFATSITMKARTDAEGRYAFRGVPPELEGRQAASAFNVTHPRFEARSKHYLQNEWLGPGWDVTLEPGCVLTGTVVDEDGKPVAEATVMAAFKSTAMMMTYPTTTTDDEGRFRFEALPECPVNLTIDAKANPVTNATASTKRGEVIEVKVPVPKGEFITGKVLGTNGKPVADALVGWLQAVDTKGKRQPDFRKLAKSNEDGTFRIGPVYKGRYRVMGSSQSPKSNATVEAEAGGEPVVIELKPAPGDQ